MRITELVKIDNKGRITIPIVVRELLGLREGSYLVLVMDPSTKQIVLVPANVQGENLYEIEILFKDVTGALAKVSEALAEHGVNQIMTNCKTIRKGVNAECHIIAEISSEEELRKSLQDLDVVIDVKMKRLK